MQGKHEGFPAHLLLGYFIGDNGSAVHLRSGCDHRKHGSKWETRLRNGFAFDEIPHISVVFSTNGDGLGAVKDASTANGQYKINVMLPAQCHAFVDRRQARIRFHTGKLRYHRIRFLQ